MQNIEPWLQDGILQVEDDARKIAKLMQNQLTHLEEEREEFRRAEDKERRMKEEEARRQEEEHLSAAADVVEKKAGFRVFC